MLWGTCFFKERDAMAGNDECRSPLHDQHLCGLIEDGFNRKYPRRFREMVAEPKFKCRLCGAKANDKENLCSPEEI